MPAVLVITEPFTTIARSFAPTIGAPNYRSIVTVSHPLATRGPAELTVIAKTIADEVVRLLTT